MPTVKYRQALTGLVLVLAGAAYLWGATAHARRVNTSLNDWDQGAFLDAALSLRGTDYGVLTNRNQMPLYPLYLSLFVRRGDNNATFFPRAKAASIALSFPLLAAIFVGLVRRLPRHETLNIFLITLFTVFIFKAPYCQSEPLHYTLVFLAYLSMLDSLGEGRLRSALLASVFSALAWLTKASNLPGFLLYLIFLVLRAVVALREGARPRASRLLMSAVVAAALFLGILAPYLMNSRRYFGRAFYNINTHFYVWHDSWGDAMAHQRSLAQRGLEVSHPPANESLGPLTYWRSHSLRQIGRRVGLGSIETLLVAAMSFGYFEYALGYFLLTALLAVWQRRRLVAAIRERPAPLGFAAAFLTVNFLLCAFYVPIAPGPRFALSLFLPFMFTAAAAVRRLGADIRISLFGRSFPLVPAFNTFLSLVLALDVLQILAKGLFTMAGGA